MSNDASRESADLRQSRPVDPSGEPGSRLQTIAAPSTVPFVDRLDDLAAGFMLKLRVGGKSPREIRRRTWRADRAD